MKTLLTTVENLSNMFHSRMSKFEADLHNNTSPHTNIAGLAGEFSSFRDFVVDVLKSLQQQVESLVCSMDNLEMQGRRKILLIHGVEEEKKEDLMLKVQNIIQTQLEVVDFNNSDIKRCHRLGRPTAPHRHRPILIKLQNLSIRDKVWFSKIKLKGSGITLSEFLTKPRHDLFLAAREMFGVAKCWTRDGTIFVLGANGERHKVSTRADLMKLAPVISEDTTNVEPTTRKNVTTKTKRPATRK